MKVFPYTQEKDARKFAEKYDGVLYWRDDWQDSRKTVNQIIDTVESNANVVGLKIGKIER